MSEGLSGRVRGCYSKGDNFWSQWVVSMNEESIGSLSCSGECEIVKVREREVFSDCGGWKESSSERGYTVLCHNVLLFWNSMRCFIYYAESRCTMRLNFHFLLHFKHVTQQFVIFYVFSSTHFCEYLCSELWRLAYWLYKGKMSWTFNKRMTDKDELNES